MDKTHTEESLVLDFIRRSPALESLTPGILAAKEIICRSLRGGGRLFCCGNGGSSADSAHIAGELLKGFLLPRPLPAEKAERFLNHGPLGAMMAQKLQGSLACVDLTAQQSVISAVANDTDPRLAYAQQLWGLGRPGDVLLGISTSGNAENVLCAGIAAAELSMKTIALTGSPGGAMARHFDLSIRVPAERTPDAQEMHVCVYHLLCALVEADFFG